MFMQRKALYNLLKLNINHFEPGEEIIASLEPWQIENYRDLSTDEIFSRLHKSGILLDAGDFERSAEHYESPEEMAEDLLKEKTPLEQDRLYLLFFDLWRRLLPERRVLSIFCDELDYQISLFMLGTHLQTGILQDDLVYLQQLLEDYTDNGTDPKDALHGIQSFCANCLESFLFDYSLAQIEAGDSNYAREILEGFSIYVDEPVWFEYLQARVDILEDPEEGYGQLENLIASFDRKSSLPLIEEILHFLATSGNHSLFQLLAVKTLEFLELEEDFREFLEICFSHYEYLELQKPIEAIAHIYHSRKQIPSETLLNHSDGDLSLVRSILDRKLHFAIE